jgi:hypothetical protein
VSRVLSIDQLLERNDQLLALAEKVRTKCQELRGAAVEAQIEARHVKRRLDVVSTIVAKQRRAWIAGKPNHRA